ncbi:hypothetical protein NKH77_21285 [Streptomyces sp. M19]
MATFAGPDWNGPGPPAAGRVPARFCPYDDGLAAERVVRRVFLDEPARALPPVVPLDARRPARPRAGARRRTPSPPRPRRPHPAGAGRGRMVAPREE